MNINLRDYQRACIDSIKKLKGKGINRQVIVAATGSGKTVIFSSLIKELGTRALIIAHTTELLYQAKEKITMIAPELSVGIVDGDNKEFNAHIVISSVQSASVTANLQKLKEQNFALLIWDECHRSATDGARKILTTLDFDKTTKKLLVGFTATAYREDNKGLGEVFDVIAFEKNAQDLIEEGYLVPPQGFKIATDVDFSHVKVYDGDFTEASLSEIMDTPCMNKLVVQSYLKEAKNLPAICFGTTVKHARNLMQAFIDEGVAAEVITGDMPKKERSAILERYTNGKTKVLCNCQILTEGVDLPHTSCVIVARPTQSKGLYTQMVGRGLRPCPWINKKMCIVLDFSAKNHNICNVGMLLNDSDKVSLHNKKKKSSEPREFKILDPSLQSALVTHDPLGKSFNWECTRENTYIMRGSNDSYIEIQKTNNKKYRVIFYNGSKNKIIADNLTFEWAFSTAEDYAKSNRNLFIISDKKAPWRNEAATESQKILIKKLGYKEGTDSLRRGQASDIINRILPPKKTIRKINL